MLGEIHEQSNVARSCLEAYLSRDYLVSGSLDTSASPLTLGLPDTLTANLEQVRIFASGSSWHAGLIGQYLIEKLAGIPTLVRRSPEFLDAPPPLAAHTLAIAVTQSGETADTLQALQIERSRCSGQAPRFQSQFLGMVNHRGSSLERFVSHVIVTPAGVEKAIAATKTFTAQLITFYCLALHLAWSRKTLSLETFDRLLGELQLIPEKIEIILENQALYLKDLAYSLANVRDLIVVGRGINFPIALEGALKAKETCYLHAEGYHAGEFMHGPKAILDENVPAIVLAVPGSSCEKVLKNAREIKACGSRAIGITSLSDSLPFGKAKRLRDSSASRETAEIFDDAVTIPATDELLSPILTVIPLQLLAYYIATHRGLDVDSPRYLTKARTSE